MVVVNGYGGTLEDAPGLILYAQPVVDESRRLEELRSRTAIHLRQADKLQIVQRTGAEFDWVDILVKYGRVSSKHSSYDDLDVEAFIHVFEIALLGSRLHFCRNQECRVPGSMSRCRKSRSGQLISLVRGGLCCSRVLAGGD